MSKGIRDGVIALVKSVATGIERIIIRGDYAEIRYVDDSDFDMAIAEPGRVVIVVFQNELRTASRSETHELETELKKLPAKVLIAKVIVERNETLLDRIKIDQVPAIRIYMAGKLVREFSDRFDEKDIMHVVQYQLHHPPSTTAEAYMGPMQHDWLPKGVRKIEAEKEAPVTPLDIPRSTSDKAK
ncbi:MAG: hypothetical protein KJO79_00975 [Verrucomicrobiae bacterium]|nr:hypothetical protein [Verrucomicrobiae bacterium]NNJ85719.1 hypothetical protein [Akkermansiaceae bacterium]